VWQGLKDRDYSQIVLINQTVLINDASLFNFQPTISAKTATKLEFKNYC
jgi:hypothetical protein